MSSFPKSWCAPFKTRELRCSGRPAASIEELDIQERWNYSFFFTLLNQDFTWSRTQPHSEAFLVRRHIWRSAGRFGRALRPVLRAGPPRSEAIGSVAKLAG